MATYIKTLKEDNGDITYPQTKAGAVLLNNGSDLETELSQYVTAEDIASTSALTPPVQTNMIANGAVTTGKIANKAVTSDKINWTTFDESEWPAFTTATKNNNVNSDGWYDQYSYTIPADGAYIANFSQQMTSGGNSKDFQVNLILGTKSLITLASGGSSWVNYIQASANASFVAKKGDILKARSKGGGSGSFSTRYGNISIARIR